jgi:putative transcriptional regulator
MVIEDGDDPAARLEDYLPGDLAKRARSVLGMTQREFADLIRVPMATVQNWEQHRVRPEPAARTLLMVLLRQPRAALRALRHAA